MKTGITARQILKATIVSAAKDQGLTELEVITIIQGNCVERNDDETLDILCNIKWDYIK